MKTRIAAFLAAAVCSATAPLRADVAVAFPAERQRLPAVEQVYVIGSVDLGWTAPLLVNGATTDVHRTGAFIAMVPVKPGTNVVTVVRGDDRLDRRFVVARPPAPSFLPPPSPPKPIASDDDPRLGAAGAWRTTGSLFMNRVREAPDGGESLFYLPKDFTLRGAPVKGTQWVAVWLEDRLGFLPRKVLAAQPAAALPPKALVAPDVCAGFADRPPYGRRPEDVRICVDAGHGGSDSGALSPHGWKEKDVNLMQAQAIRAALEKVGFQVVMTRSGDSFPALFDRPLKAYSERVDAFISVHHNATAPQRDPRLVRHTTTYAATANGLLLARCIQKHVGAALSPVRDAGAQMKSLAVCRNPAVPSCLIEVDFINLPDGEADSWDPARHDRVAQAVVCGVLDWMSPPLDTTPVEVPTVPVSEKP